MRRAGLELEGATAMPPGTLKHAWEVASHHMGVVMEADAIARLDAASVRVRISIRSLLTTCVLTEISTSRM